MRCAWVVVTAVVVLAACSGSDGVSTMGGGAQPVQFDLAAAISVNVAARGDAAVVAWTEPAGVFVGSLDLATGDITSVTEVQGGFAPFPHPIERPAIAIDDDGRVHVAFTTLVGDSGSVVSAVVDGEKVTNAEVISGAPRVETVLVHTTDFDGARAAMAWLEDSTLSVAFSDASGSAPIEFENVDDLTCDCCNPAPVLIGADVVVAYRDLQRHDGDVIRDVASTRLNDGGSVFSPPVPIADDHWYLDACPFSGPDAVEVAGDIVVTWMDARQSRHPDQDSTTIWIDRSTDGGASYGTDLALTDGGIHRWPVMAVDAEATVHVVWETQASDGGITYASSSDGGRSFTEPRLLVANTEATGHSHTASIAVSGDNLLVAWLDSEGAHVVAYPLAGLAG